MKTIENIRSVEDYFEWRKNSKRQTVEKCNESLTQKLAWEKTDVLYSFLEIYLIGVRALYPDCFKTTTYQIRQENNNANAYSFKYLSENYNKFTDVNELDELKSFLKVYASIGNVIPVWPVANRDKGMSQCFDIPEIYFSKYPLASKVLSRVYQNAYMESIIRNEREIVLSDLLRMDGKASYKEFLKYIKETIDSRTERIHRWLNSN